MSFGTAVELWPTISSDGIRNLITWDSRAAFVPQLEKANFPAQNQDTSILFATGIRCTVLRSYVSLRDNSSPSSESSLGLFVWSVDNSLSVLDSSGNKDHSGSSIRGSEIFPDMFSGVARYAGFAICLLSKDHILGSCTTRSNCPRIKCFETLANNPNELHNWMIARWPECIS